MANFKLVKHGDWAKVRHLLGYTFPRLAPFAVGQIDQYGEVALEIIKGHIQNQSLPWTPLSSETISRKGGSEIYIESGTLVNGVEVKKLSTGGNEMFIGFSDGTKHPSGLSFGQLMVFLEYGTANAPPRPLIRPSFDEVKALIKKDFAPAIKKYLSKG